MKNLLAFCLTFTLAALVSGCAGTSSTTTGTTPAATPTTAQKIQAALLTTANVLQQSNTGLQKTAPTIEAVLTQTHNQGDAQAVNQVATESAAFTPALANLLNLVATAIAAAPTPAAQVAAVNTALSPASVAAIVAPIQTATH